jgi:hypothetical protein
MGGMGGGMGMGGNAPGAQPSAPIVIEQSETEIRITSTVMGKQVVDTYKLDGKAVTQMVDQIPGFGGGGRAGFGQQQTTGAQIPKTIQAKLNKGTLDVKEVSSSQNGKSTVKKTYTLSKDGKVLTLKISTSTSTSPSTGGMGGMGMGGMGGGSAIITSQTQKLVFNKQKDNT